MKTRIVFVVLAICAAPLFAQAESLDATLARVQRLIAAKDFAAAEALAQHAVEHNPHSRVARSTLAWATLWNGDYDAARAQFRELLATNANDASAQLGLAQSEYWSGDLRSAQRDFNAVLRLDPGNADARRALDEIHAATQPGYTIGIDGISDDQPYRSAAARTTVFGFRDASTKWLVSAMSSTFDSDLRDANARAIGAGVDATRSGFTLRVNATLFRFPDATHQLLPHVELAHPFASTTLAVIAERRELLRAAPALATHPSANAFAIRWSRDAGESMQFAVRAERLRYFDDNAGVGADAWFLIPFRNFAAGASIAYRDTDESRFNGVVYDPYYTPQQLREARLIAAAHTHISRALVDLHLDGGVAHDELFGAGRTFHPWRASLNASIPLTSRLTLSAGVEHNVTIYYTANEFRTSVAGRF